MHLKILVTAGPTREALDPVRFLSNRSSGKMGYAIAKAAVRDGHQVCLISGPVALETPEGVECIRITTAAEMFATVTAKFNWCEAVIMAAAVADWRPKKYAPGKLKKSGRAMTLELERTVDILKSLGQDKGHRLLIGFAAETTDMLQEARRKLIEKNLDMIVANDVSRTDAGFGVDHNAVTFVTKDAVEELPLMSKNATAEKIINRLEQIGAERGFSR